MPLVKNDFNETQSLLEFTVKAPKAVVYLLSALSFHNQTTQNPFEVWIALDRGSRIPKIESVGVRIFRFASKVYEADNKVGVLFSRFKF